MAGSEPTVFKNVCPLDCPDTCSMRVTVRDGVAVELKGDAEHPFTRGFLCRKMARYLDRVYSPDRLMFPMKRVGRKGEGRFERISWDEALDTIAARFGGDRGVAGRAAGHPALQLLRHDGEAPVQQPGPEVLPPAGRLEAGPDDLRLGGLAGLRVHGRTRTHGRRPAGGAAVQVHRQLGLEHGQHQQSSLEPDGRGPQEARRDDRDRRSLPQPDRQPLRLAHRATPGHRCGPGPRADARDLAGRAPGRRLSESSHRGCRRAPPAGARGVSRRIGSPPSPGSTSPPSRPSPAAWPASSRR